MAHLPDPFSSPALPGLRPSSDRVEVGERRYPDGTVERWIALVRTYVPWSSSPSPTVVTAPAREPWTREEWRTFLRRVGPLGYGLAAVYFVCQMHTLVDVPVLVVVQLLPVALALRSLCRWGGMPRIGLLTFGALLPPVTLAVVLVAAIAEMVLRPPLFGALVLAWLLYPSAVGATALATLAVEARQAAPSPSPRDHGGGAPPGGSPTVVDANPYAEGAGDTDAPSRG